VAIALQDDHQQRAELRSAFLKHLPKRVGHLVRRGRRLCEAGADINELSLLHQDVEQLAGTAGRYGALEVSEQLLALEGVLASCLAREALPDRTEAGQLELVFAAVLRELPAVATSAVPTARATATIAPAVQDPQEREPHLGRAETPPSHYWRRWSTDTPAAEPAGAMPAAQPARSEPAEAPARRAAANPARIYHLSDGSGLATALDQQLETHGHEIEILADSDELKEVLAALAPDLVVVDAGFADDLEAIGAVVRSTRERAGTRLPLLAITDHDTMAVRLAARRAGTDALLVQPRQVAEVVARIDELLEGAGHQDDSYRVLIVEDDRAQGLFAESILRNAGMQARVVDDAFEVIAAMEAFAPDLVLMDLYMPQCDGMDLTALIREREEFLHTPIVFLSGEADLDKHYAALDAGGDDFLSKPIRPKHLISAVSNRIHRARAMTRRIGQRDPRDAATGLMARGYALDQINAILAEDEVRTRPGGVLFIDIDGVTALRERLGLSASEQVLADVARLVVGQLAGNEFASRFGDGSFLAICPHRPDGALLALAAELRSLLISHAFAAGSRPLRIRLAIGICAFRLGFADAAALLNTAERAGRDARALERGVMLFEPPRRAGDAEEAAIAALIRHAVEHDGFELLYQPIVAVQGGNQAQYQTLLRLRDDSGRMHAAGTLIPVAERADLMLDIDRWVLGQALRTIEQRTAQRAPVRLFVNQSARTVASIEHGQWLAAQIRARNLPGPQLVLELALDELDADLEAIAAFCNSLVPTGVQFCVNRFEAGERGTAALEALPVGYLKLAPKYLAATQARPLRDELRLLIDDAHGRGLQVIAQRVEDAQSAATLWMSGIDFIQGNLVQHAGRELAFDFQAAVL
jgi:diguanylate cyclase (GGDEF)-like protein